MPATDTDDGMDVVFSWLDVPTIRASDLSGFNCRPFCMYHCLTSAVQAARTARPSAQIKNVFYSHSEIEQIV